jgi:hypothetical protein
MGFLSLFSMGRLFLLPVFLPFLFLLLLVIAALPWVSALSHQEQRVLELNVLTIFRFRDRFSCQDSVDVPSGHFFNKLVKQQTKPLSM